MSVATLRFLDEKLEINLYRPNIKTSHSNNRCEERKIFDNFNNVFNSVKYYLCDEQFRDLVMNELNNEKFVIEDCLLMADYVMNIENSWCSDTYVVDLNFITVWNAINGWHCRKGKSQKILHIGNDGIYVYTLEGGVKNAVFAEVC